MASESTDDDNERTVGLSRYLTFIVIVAVSLSHPFSLSAQFLSRTELNNGYLKLTLNQFSKTWNLEERVGSEWVSVIVNATSVLTFKDRDSLTLSLENAEIKTQESTEQDVIGKGKKLFVRISNAQAQWSLSFLLYDNTKKFRCSASIKNLSGESWNTKEFRLLDCSNGALSFATTNVLMHVNGYQSWSNSEIVALDSTLRYTSYWSTLFYEPEAYRSMLVGFVTNTQATNSIRTDVLNMEYASVPMQTVSDVKTVTVRPKVELQSDELLLSLQSSPFDNLQEYGQYLQAFAPLVYKPFTPKGKEPITRTDRSGVPTGWCSWYYYYQNISEDSIIQNLNVLADSLKESGAKYIQIDDGFQIAAGDWNTNAKFPHGHQWLVQQIHAKGLLAGLWVAPFAVAESSAVYREHKNWLLRDENDAPKEFFANDWWGGRIFALDPTIPEVQQWLEVLFATITKVWGYDYVKIDFLYFAGEGGKYRQPVSSAQAYQMGLRAIRKGVGSDKFILGCGAPIGSSIGYVDGMRIGSDIYAAWGGILPGVNAIAQRFFYHNNVWYNDPDCLVVREPLTMEQARVWATAIALSGQMNMMSDKLPDLSSERIELLKMTLPSYDVAAQMIDVFSQPKELGLTLQSADKQSTLKLPSTWKFIVGDSMAYKEQDWNDGEWKDIPVPARWENVGFPDVDSIVWYRVKFTLPKSWQRGPVTFSFAKIDDCDETYLNGTLIGKTGTFPPNYSTEWTTFREYVLPESLINWQGENVLAVRVYDGGGPGGIYSTKQFNLPSIWHLPIEKPFERYSVVGLFNWQNSDQKFSLTPQHVGLSQKKRYVVLERWSNVYLGEFEKNFSLTLPPTSSRILSIHEMKNQPMVLSTSRHIIPGAIDLANSEWNQKTKTLTVTCENLTKGPYTVILYVPEHLKFKQVITSLPNEVTQPDQWTVSVYFHNVTLEKMQWKAVFE